MTQTWSEYFNILKTELNDLKMGEAQNYEIETSFLFNEDKSLRMTIDIEPKAYKNYKVYGYGNDDELYSIIVKASSEDEARKQVEDLFYYGTTEIVEVAEWEPW